MTTGNLLPQDGELRLIDGLLGEGEAQALLDELRATLDWRQETLSIMGRQIAVPRLTAWYGEAGYRYSGIDHPPAALPPALARVRQLIEAAAGTSLNTVLANLYRDGADGMGWHADDEPELGQDPVIASLSLGATRRFQLKHKTDKGLRLEIELASGSCLIMAGSIQHHWLHRVPKTRRPIGPRINLTWRQISAHPEAQAM